MSKPGADLAGEDEVVALEVADEQRAESDARALRVGEAADDEVLRRSHFILSQCFDRFCSYGESRRFAITPSHPSAHARSHGSASSSSVHSPQRRRERQRVEQRAALGERQAA